MGFFLIWCLFLVLISYWVKRWNLMIKVLLAFIALYAFIHLVPNPKPGPKPIVNSEEMVPLPIKPLGRFETATAARQCGAILGRVVRCHLPRNDRNRLISYCTDGLITADGQVNARLYQVFLNGTGDGERNVHGWSCGRLEKTLASPLLPSRVRTYD